MDKPPRGERFVADPPAGWLRLRSPPTPHMRKVAPTASWQVTTTGEALSVTPHDDGEIRKELPFRPMRSPSGWLRFRAARRHVLRVRDGWLVGLDHGEFGGGLWWFSVDGAECEELLSENILGLVRTGTGPLILAGLFHLGTDRGGILRFDEDGSHGVHIVADFARPDGKEDASTPAGETALRSVIDDYKRRYPLTNGGLNPERLNRNIEPIAAAAVRSGLIIAATLAGIFAVDSARRSTLVMEASNYEPLRPCSVAVTPSDVIYVGMNWYVAQLTPTAAGYHAAWFVPASA